MRLTVSLAVAIVLLLGRSANAWQSGSEEPAFWLHANEYRYLLFPESRWRDGVTENEIDQRVNELFAEEFRDQVMPSNGLVPEDMTRDEREKWLLNFDSSLLPYECRIRFENWKTLIKKHVSAERYTGSRMNQPTVLREFVNFDTQDRQINAAENQGIREDRPIDLDKRSTALDQSNAWRKQKLRDHEQTNESDIESKGTAYDFVYKAMAGLGSFAGGVLGFVGGTIWTLVEAVPYVLAAIFACYYILYPAGIVLVFLFGCLFSGGLWACETITGIGGSGSPNYNSTEAVNGATPWETDNSVDSELEREPAYVYVRR